MANGTEVSCHRQSQENQTARADPDALPQLFSAGGLGDVERGSITIRMNFANFDDYWQPLLGGQGPFGT